MGERDETHFMNSQIVNIHIYITFQSKVYFTLNKTIWFNVRYMKKLHDFSSLL